MFEEGLRLRRGVYTETMLLGKEANATFIEANNYSSSLVCLKRQEAKALLRKTVPVARRVLGERTHAHVEVELRTGALGDAGATLMISGGLIYDRGDEPARGACSAARN